MVSLTSKRHAKRYALIAILALACAALVMMVQLPAKAAHADESAVKMNRLYNPNSGEHFYTASPVEKVSLMDAGWNYEGIGWTAPADGNAVYRLYSGTDHHYTMSEVERDHLISVGWSYEGIGWYSDADESVALYRQFNPNVQPSAPTNNSGSHNYTLSKVENDSLVSAGWNEEGIGWYGINGTSEQDLFLGSFFIDTPGQGAGFETALCYTRDGINFTKASTPFASNADPLHDPSIMFKDGTFYMLSNWNRNNGRFYPMISYSENLVDWTQPEGLGLINGGSYDGISLSSMPFGISDFDVVAPEWFVDDNGDTYIIFSAGYYGDYHGQPESDRMKVYAVKVDISNNGLASSTSGSGKHFPQGLKLDASTAFEIQGLEASDNYIDSSIYKDGDTYYLITKKDGVNNQIYANSSMSPDGWHLVNTNIATGNEGPTMVNVDGVYMLYTDMIATYHGQTGIQVSASLGENQPFSAPQSISCVDGSGNKVTLRHGTVIKLEGEAKALGESFIRL